LKTATRTIVLLLAVPVLGAITAAVWVISSGLSARAYPGKFEHTLAGSVRRAAIPRAAREMKNPFPAAPEILIEARRHFADHCANCHGNDGGGNTEIGQHLYPPAPDMSLPETQNLTDGELYYIIENGVRFTGMPAWGAGGTNDPDTWHLVLFIRHMPKMSQQDMLDMKDYNPRSPMEMQEEEKENQFLNERSK
jgi:mono/diheme cytochrome c family protein